MCIVVDSSLIFVEIKPFGYGNQTVNLVPSGEWFESTSLHHFGPIVVIGKTPDLYSGFLGSSPSGASTLYLVPCPLLASLGYA